jgi:hypothetical protein
MLDHLVDFAGRNRHALDQSRNVGKPEFDKSDAVLVYCG